MNMPVIGFDHTRRKPGRKKFKKRLAHSRQRMRWAKALRAPTVREDGPEIRKNAPIQTHWM